MILIFVACQNAQIVRALWAMNSCTMATLRDCSQRHAWPKNLNIMLLWTSCFFELTSVSTWVIKCPHWTSPNHEWYMVYNGYYFRWCPIYPKWDSYQPLINDSYFRQSILSMEPTPWHNPLLPLSWSSWPHPPTYSTAITTYTNTYDISWYIYIYILYIYIRC